jgi:hypothetical protein
MSEGTYRREPYRPEPYRPEPEPEEADPALERIQRDRKPGEIETGMMSGSDEAEISATERFEGELSEDEALRALRPG